MKGKNAIPIKPDLREEYLEKIRGEDDFYLKDSRVAKAYDVALDIRKFEIDLYWKRSASFWLFLGGVAAALGFSFYLKDLTDPSMRSADLVCMLLSGLGALASFSWYLVNKASKFWQRNWEFQVQMLENEVVGPLYKTVLAECSNRRMHSVTKINEFVSLMFFGAFFLLTLFFFIGRQKVFVFIDRPSAFWMIKGVLLSIFFVGLFFVYFWSRNDRSDSSMSSDVDLEASEREVKLVKIYPSRSVSAGTKRKRIKTGVGFIPPKEDGK